MKRACSPSPSSGKRSRRQSATSAPLDFSKYQVSSSPNIWVFDDLLSAKTLEHVNSLCDSKVADENWEPTACPGRYTKGWLVGRNESTRELFDAISKISRVNYLERFDDEVLVSDVRGEDQNPHIDHISTDVLKEKGIDLSIIDMSKQSECKKRQRYIVPTFSLIVYFNDVGGVTFPRAAEVNDEIKGKPGRIIMFENYIDSQRPLHNELACHYGSYFEDRPKRLITMGILANQTPTPDGSNNVPTGLIYCPGACSHHSHGQEAEDNAAAAANDRQAKAELKLQRYLALTVSVERQMLCFAVSVTNMAGEEKCSFELAANALMRKLEEKVKAEVDPADEYELGLITTDGRLLSSESVATTPIERVFDSGDAPKVGDEIKVTITVRFEGDTWFVTCSGLERTLKFKEAMRPPKIGIVQKAVKEALDKEDSFNVVLVDEDGDPLLDKYDVDAPLSRVFG